MKVVKFIIMSAALIAGSVLANNRLADSVVIPYQYYRLDNGLTLLVHRDKKAPIVAVNIWYHTGSKDEKIGRTGFAHLFEHLMFNGSENHPGEWFDTMEKIGATDLNGTTWLDRTNYFQTVPKTALDTVLWMESDRMGHFLGAVTQEVLDEQRGVVQNEKRRGQNRPYGRSWETIQKAIFPTGHPYSWTTIGSMEDLEAATLEDTHDWFNRFYGAANAVLVVAGDVEPEAVKRRVTKHFGNIAPGPALLKQKTNIAKRTKSTKDIMFDNVAHTRITKVWNIAEFGTKDSVMLDLAARVLGSGKNSRLYKTLVHDNKLANSMASYQYAFEIAGIFIMQATINNSKDSAEVERIMHRELKKLLAKGPSKKELERIKNKMLVDILGGLETVGGFSGKAQILARYQTYTGNANNYKQYLNWLENATVKDVQTAAKKWLTNGDYTLLVKPQPKFKTSGEDVARAEVPMPADFPSYAASTVAKFKLSNGIPVWLIARAGVPIIKLQTIFKRGGYADDSSDTNGLAKFTAAMMMEGSKGYSALQMSAAIEQLGSSIGVGAGLDGVTASLSSLKGKNFAKTLQLYHKVLRQPTFTEAAIDRVRINQLASIKKEQKSPFSQALRVLPLLLYKDSHPYSKPLTGTGTQQSVAAISKTNIAEFYKNYYLPSQAHFVVVGDITSSELKRQLEAEFGDWNTNKSLAELDYSNPGKVLETEFYLLDKPESPQALILAGHLLEKQPNNGNQNFDMALRVLGGNFNSRINMNLREDKSWAYGARALKATTNAQEPLIYYASVQIDKTRDSIFEILKEVRQYIADKPVTKSEISRGQQGLLASLPGKFETSGDVLGYLSGQVRKQRSDDYLEKYQSAIRNLTVTSVSAEAKKFLNPEKMIWVIVGDKKVLKQQLINLPFDKTIKEF